MPARAGSSGPAAGMRGDARRRPAAPRRRRRARSSGSAGARARGSPRRRSSIADAGCAWSTASTARRRRLGRLFVVVGVFDGLHRGPRSTCSRELAARPPRRTTPGRPSSRSTTTPTRSSRATAPPLLCDPDERLERLAAAGVAVTVVQTFDVALRETPYDAFVRRIADRVELAGFLMTPESAFGYERGGTPETVAALGRELGYDVVVVPAVHARRRARAQLGHPRGDRGRRPRPGRAAARPAVLVGRSGAGDARSRAERSGLRSPCRRRAAAARARIDRSPDERRGPRSRPSR